MPVPLLSTPAISSRRTGRSAALGELLPPMVPRPPSFLSHDPAVRAEAAGSVAGGGSGAGPGFYAKAVFSGTSLRASLPYRACRIQQGPWPADCVLCRDPGAASRREGR